MRLRVSDAMNQGLIGEVTNEEIKSVVFSIKASGSPGPDGMLDIFFQQFWEEIGPKVSLEVKKFFERGRKL